MEQTKRRATILVVVIALTGWGCSRHHPNPPPAGPTVQPLTGFEAQPTGYEAELIASERKAVMGRAESLSDIARVLHDDDPLVRAATQLPDVQPALSRMANDEGVDLATMRDRWALLQDADILIESGGDPEAVSVAGAVGVSQWMPGAFGHGAYPVNLAKSQDVTDQIDDVEWKLAWLRYWSTPGDEDFPLGLARATPREASAQIPALQTQLSALQSRRIAVDGRYDPKRAIEAQTRYLVGLYDRFPSVDWLFQAYHGGEAGVDRLVKRYLGAGWPGLTSGAIRAGDSGQPLTYAKVYDTVAPRSHTDAFLYLYGRGDDHRHYWWKIQAAIRALQLYRSDPSGFRDQWAALDPGRSIAATWYPDSDQQAFVTTDGMRRARSRGALVAIEAPSGVTIASQTVPGIPVHPLLGAPAIDMLRQVATAYRNEGGVAPLTVVRAAATAGEAETIRRRGPPPLPSHRRFRPMPPAPAPPGFGPPAGFDFHTIGAAFDLAPPSDRTNRKILTYVLDRMQVDGTIHWYVDRDTSPSLDRWVVIAAPTRLRHPDVQPSQRTPGPRG